MTLCVADGTKAAGALAAIVYNDAWMNKRMSQKAKLCWMLEGEEAGALPGALAVERELLDDMRPVPFLNGSLLSIFDCFDFASSGVETTRDHLSYGLNDDDLKTKVGGFIALAEAPARDLYSPTRKAAFGVAYAAEWDAQVVRAASYRPLDRRKLYNRPGYVDWPRPKLQEAWGDANLALFAMPFGTGIGPAVWCHGSLPDRHAFRGSYGGYAFPLYDRRAGHGPFNLKPELVSALSDAYGGVVMPEQTFDSILTLLSATSYTTRFAEDLEDVFPHIPFPADRALFDAAAAIGAEIRAVETFARLPRKAFINGRALAQTAPTGKLAPVAYEDGGVVLCADGSGRIAPIPPEVWAFAVSGYRVLPRWLAAREGMEIGDRFIPELRDLVGRIGELIDLFARADSLLVQTLDDPLSRESLNLRVPAPHAEEATADHD